MKRGSEQVVDEWLVLRSQEGSPAALNLLLKRWQTRLGMRALRLTGEEDAIDDILQETLIAIARGIDRLNDPAAFPAWAFRVVSNKSRDWIRKQVRDRDLSKSEFERNQMDAEPTADRPADRMRECLNLLSEDDREILRLHYYEGFSIREIAEIESLPEGSVKSKLFYARERLRVQVEKELNP